MKPVALGFFQIKSGSGFLFHFSLWLIGLPACLYVLYLYARPSAVNTTAPVTVVERWIEPVSGYGFNRRGFGRLSQRAPDFKQAHWERITLPDSRPLPATSPVGDDAPMAQAWFRLRYTPPADFPPGEDIAFYVTRIMGGAASVWLDGHLLEQNLEDWRMQWNKPLYVNLPVSQFKPGRPIEIALAVPFREWQGYAVGSFFIGPAAEVRPLHEARVFWQATLLRAGVLVALLLGGLAFFFWLPRRNETPYLLLFLTSVAWFIYNLQYFKDFSDDPVAALWFGAIVSETRWSTAICMSTVP
jgi:hypothetical protein